ncbi:Pimeloyl-ACP methyl ester carboxylesterase [Pseudonocardia thermophila]|jgi:Predicted hydrolases or acyltransferases (alpha/beta hydrolase superfamily)|uniref:Pimeloyl-ACP methyl ester carboxylesterase n=1 Tax=Pseudonocardia thermophila TaxID=1848 RepID=A0A1M6Q4Z6_PSETH|nr:alpha/beta hydrolase [Pseudonocardia thermophila]SHK15339.1 Pimeloyl-ACP methyl ester carboxylesterase [Pseudonocardia thermophila]
MSHLQGEPEWITTADGRQLYTMVLPGPGEDAPTVVFEAGSGSSRSYWALVQPAVGQRTRAIVYDRSGLGRSAPDPVSRTLSRMADDLSTVLDHAGPGPFVLVGHSAGGPVVRLAAARAPERIAGLVLVDPTDEAAPTLFSPAFRRAERTGLRVQLLLARAGLLQHAHRSLRKQLPADARRDIDAEGFTPGAVRTMQEQAKTFLDELAAFREHPPELGGIPVTVISGARAGTMPRTFRREFTAAHAERARRSVRGRHVVAPYSAHDVPITEPHVVIGEILRLCGLSSG